MKESDWKLLRKLKPVLLERLCERILQECREAIAEEDGSAHERYLHLFALLRTRNDDVAICFDDHRRSNAILKLAAIYQRGLLEDEQLAQFSEVTQATVRALSTRVGGSAKHAQMTRDRGRAPRPRGSAGEKLGGRRIVLASQTEIDTIDPFLADEFLDRIFDMGGALVTDESRLSDFISFGTDAEEAAEAVTKIRSEYGISVGIDDRLFEVLRRIAGRKLEARDETAPS